MKKLANLKGVKALDRNAQKAINGGGPRACSTDSDCSDLGDCFICLMNYCIEPFENSNCNP